VGGVGVEEADPEIALDLLQLAQEVGERIAAGRIDGRSRAGLFFPAVHAEVGGVLRNEVEFLDALGDEAAHFGDDGGDGAAAMASAHLRDDAEGTGMVAALGDFDVGGVRGGEAEAGRVEIGNEPGLSGDEIFRQAVGRGGAVLGQKAFNDRGDLGELVEADEGIDFGHGGA